MRLSQIWFVCLAVICVALGIIQYGKETITMPVASVELEFDTLDSLLEHPLSEVCRELCIDESTLELDAYNSAKTAGTYSFYGMTGTLYLDFSVDDPGHESIYRFRIVTDLSGLERGEIKEKYAELYDRIEQEKGSATSRLFMSGNRLSDYWENERVLNRCRTLKIAMDQADKTGTISYGITAF